MHKTIIFILWFVCVIIGLAYPMFSFHEMHMVPQSYLMQIDPAVWWYVRWISVGAMAGVVLMLMSQVRSYVALSMVVTAPWIYLLAREWNPIVLVWVFFLTLYYVLSLKKKHSAQTTHIILVGLIGYCMIVGMIYHVYTWESLLNRYDMMIRQLSLFLWFVTMDDASRYLFIPFMGYFYIIALPIFLIGLVHIKRREIAILLGLSLLFYFVYPVPQLIFGGVGFLLVIQIIIMYGADYSAHMLITYKNKTWGYWGGIGLFALMVFVQTMFFFEVYFRHYEMKYGYERGYKEIALVQWLGEQQHKERVILTYQSDLDHFEEVFQVQYNMPVIEFVPNQELSYWNKYKDVCSDKAVYCVVPYGLLRYFHVSEDSGDVTIIDNIDGAPAYYVL